MAFDIVPARLGLGLNLVDAPEALEDGAARILRNWRLTGRGRISTRRTATALAGTYDGDIIGVFPFVHAAGVGGVVLTRTAGGTVKLYTVNGDGLSPSLQGELAGWSSVSATVQVTATTMFRVLFITDVGRNHGLTCFDPNSVLGGGLLFQPSFNFQTGGTIPHAKMLCRGVAEHANMLFAWGYGAEEDPSRPEMLRWSYIGFNNDLQGAGDAGYLDDGTTPTVVGSTNLFDREDSAMVGERGVAIVAVGSGNGRAIVATEKKAFVLFGSDRDSFQLDEIDNQRGCVNTRAMVEAAGGIYWMSPLGPCRYTGGGGVEDLSRPIKPLLGSMNMPGVFAVHAPQENQVRFYYAEAAGPATKALIFDYYAEQWLEDELGVSVRCAGLVTPSGAEGPSGAPTALTHGTISHNQATASWTNGDTSPATVTRVYRAPDATGVPGAFTLVATVASGVTSYAHAALAASTTYWTRVEHVRNGYASTNVQASFTTLQEPDNPTPPPGGTYGQPPQNWHAEGQSVFDTRGGWQSSVFMFWDMGIPGAETQIERSTDGSDYTLRHTASANATSWLDSPVTQNATFYYRARHKVGDKFSAYTAPVQVWTTVEPM
jgi:hypothetical protein